ncbi:MAG: caspase family protein [Verrucomicrobiales bacterium]|nr:caspase family protein [Verrucomicrobiales bacterium]
MKIVTSSALLTFITGIVCLLPAGFISASTSGNPQMIIETGAHSARSNKVIFSPDGSKLISVADDKTIRVFDTQLGGLIRTFRGYSEPGSTGKIYAAAISPDGKWLVTGGYFSKDGIGNIHIIDLGNGNISAVLKGHLEVVTALSFSKDGYWLTSGDGNGEIRVWDCTNLSRASQILREHSDWIRSSTFSPDGLRMITASSDQTMILWKRNHPTGRFQVVQTLRKHTKAPGEACFSPDGKYIVSGGFDGSLLLWDGMTANFLGEIDTYEKLGVASISFSPDGKKVLAGFGKFAIVYELATGSKLETNFHNEAIRTCAWSPTGNLVATAGGYENDIYLWNPANKEIKHHITGQGQACWSAGFSKTGVKIAFGQHINPKLNYGEDRFEKIFDFETFQLLDFDPGNGDNDLFLRNITTQNGIEIEKVDGSTLKIGDRKLQQSNGGVILHYSFIPGTNRIITGQKWALRVYEPNGDNYKLLHDLKGHDADITMVSPSPDGRFLVSSSRDQTVRLWNLNQGKLLASLWVAKNGEWVCWSPQGYYATSYEGESMVRWQVNQGTSRFAKIYPGNSLRSQLHFPEYLKRTVLADLYRPATVVQRGANNYNNIPVAPSTQPKTASMPGSRNPALAPKIDWESGFNSGARTANREIKIRARIISLSTPLREIRLTVNETPITLAATTEGKNMFLLNQFITLSPGNNRIVLAADNGRGTIITEERSVIYAPTAEELVTSTNTIGKPNLFVLSIGVSDFQNEMVSDLRYCDEDAKAIGTFFTNQTGGIFNRVEAKVLTNKSATKRTIKESLEWLKRNATERDFVIVFLSAHGAKDQFDNFHFFSHDTNPANLNATGVPWNDFGDVLAKLPGRVLMFLDTCEAGQLGHNLFSMANRNLRSKSVEKAPESSEKYREAIFELTKAESGIVVMASSTGDELSVESGEWGHGALTYGLLEGLKGRADFNKDGIIHLRELDFFVSDFVIGLTNGKQHPTTVKPSTISRLPIAIVK